MKINFNYIPQIKNNFVNKSNLQFNSSLVTDVFERKNVSFGKKNTLTSKEILIKHKGFSESQADVILSIGNIGLANEIVSLMKNGYDFNSAIDEIVKNNYLFNADDFARYQNLSAISELDIIDRVAVVVYELNDEQLERYKVNKGKFTQLYEAILAVKFDLSDEEITHYLSIKNSYTLPPDELMICIKEKFNDSQLARFTELKNRKKSFVDETARKQEEQQAYPIRYIVACIKQEKSDEDIKREDEFFKNLKMYNDGHYNVFSVLSSGCHDAFSLDACDVYSKNCISKHKNLSMDAQDLLHTIKTINYESGDYNSDCIRFFYEFNNLKQEEIDIFVLRFNQAFKKYKLGDALNIALLTNEQYLRFIKLQKEGIDDFTRYQAVKLEPKQYEKFIILIHDGISANLAVHFAKMDETQMESFYEYKNNENFSSIVIIDPNTLELKTLIGDYARIFVSNLPLTKQKKMLSLQKQNLVPHEFIHLFSDFSEAQNQRYFENLANYMHPMDALDIASLNDEEYAKFCSSKFKVNIEEKCILSRLKADETLANDLFAKLKFDSHCWAEYLKLNQDQINSYNYYLQQYGRFKQDEAITYAQLNDVEYGRFLYFLHKFGKEYTAKSLSYAKLTSDEFRKYTSMPLELPTATLLELVKNTMLNSLTPELLEKLPEDFWYKINTGCEKEAHEIIQKAITELLLEQSGENNLLNLIPINKLNFQLKKPLQGSNYSKGNEYILTENGDFELKTLNPFNVNLSQGLVKQKPVLVIKDKNSDNQYVSYNGVIAKVKPIENHDTKQFETWGNLLSQKQGQILAQAADEFVFNLFDENGNCIIGNGEKAPKFDVKQKSDSAIGDFYSKEFLELKSDGNLNAQEILKLMPKNCMLTINPYIQGADFSYAIVCEWFSADNTRWQMEIHSQDSKWNNDEKWIFRLHKQTESTRQYFQFIDNEIGFNFNGETLDENAHIKIQTPLEENDLLNNIEFQTIIRQISTQQYKDFEINKIASSLNVSGRNSEEKIQNIINHCLQNPLDFARYKDIVTKLRASLGMIKLV